MPKPEQARGGQQAEGAQAQVYLPDKLYFRIGEVSKLTQTRSFVLRYWETEFPTLRPVKSRSGHRLYRREDVEMVFEIRRLLYDKGFTIEGARKQLAGGADEPRGQKPAAPSALNGAVLRTIRRELQTILTMLSRRC